MRFLIGIAVFLPCFSFAQEEDNKRFMGFGIEGAFNLLDEPTLSFAEYKAVVNGSEFILHSDDAELSSSSTLFTRNGIGVRFIIKGPDTESLGAFKRSRFNIGAQFNGGNNYTFNFHESNRIRYDTISVSSSSGYQQTLYRDTIYNLETAYSARSKNIGVSCEYLIYTGKGMPTIVTGLGLAGDITLVYKAQVRQTLTYETGLYNDGGVPIFEDVTQLTNGQYHSNVLYGNTEEKRLSTAYFIRPYIPVRIESKLSNLDKLAGFTVDINAKIGTEVQINPGASVNARMFYSLGLGLNYYY